MYDKTTIFVEIFNMKKNIIILLVLSALIMPSCIKKGKEKEVKIYTDSIVSMQNQSIARLDTFFQSLYFKDYDIPHYYQKAIEINNQNIKYLKELGPYKNNPLLYDAAYQVNVTIDQVLKNEGEQLLALYDSVNEKKKLKYQQEIDTLLRQSIAALTEQQILFDSVLTVFLGNYGFHIEMDTTAIVIQKENVK